MNPLVNGSIITARMALDVDMSILMSVFIVQHASLLAGKQWQVINFGDQRERGEVRRSVNEAGREGSEE